MGLQLHCSRGALHMHENDWNLGSRRQLYHFRIEAQGADIVNYGGAGIQSRSGHLGFAGINGDGNGRAFGQFTDDRYDPPLLFIQRDRIGKWPGGFAADIQQVCTLRG